MMTKQQTVLLVIDIQERLAPHMVARERLIAGARTLIAGARLLDIPMLLTEQYPEGIGATVPELASLLEGVTPIHKRTFSACREPRFVEALEAVGRRQVLVTGIEAHVCVYQTVVDLKARGYTVQVAADAVASRTAANRRIGIERMRALGAEIGSVESAVFELMETSACPAFKPVLKLIK